MTSTVLGFTWKMNYHPTVIGNFHSFNKKMHNRSAIYNYYFGSFDGCSFLSCCLLRGFLADTMVLRKSIGNSCSSNGAFGLEKNDKAIVASSIVLDHQSCVGGIRRSPWKFCICFSLSYFRFCCKDNLAWSMASWLKRIASLKQHCGRGIASREIWWHARIFSNKSLRSWS